jgi:hypothetical protein
VSPIQTVSENLIVLNDAVSGLTVLRLNETSKDTWNVTQAPEYLSLPLQNERVNGFSTLIYSSYASQVVVFGLLSVMMFMSNFLF